MKHRRGESPASWGQKMTKEELAKEWVEKEYDELKYEKCEKKDFVFTFYELKEMGKQAFLAGLNSKTQWHDLRENPNDLPKRKGNVVLNQDGDKVTYDYLEGRWRWTDGGIDGLEMIAWCELSKFFEG